MDLNTALKSFKGKTESLFDKDKEKLETAPYRDWVIMISIFVLVNLISAAVGLYLFVKINSGEIFFVEQRETQPSRTIDKNELKQVIETYEAKREALQDLFLKRPSVIDPSR